MTFEERLDQMEAEIHKTSFRRNRGRANEVNYWVFDYPPQRELEVRERVEYMKEKTPEETMSLNWLFLIFMI